LKKGRRRKIKADELNLIKQITELVGMVGEMKGKLSALEKENEFLRGLLKERLARSAFDTTE
jgi:hypothetical protein